MILAFKNYFQIAMRNLPQFRDILTDLINKMNDLKNEADAKKEEKDKESGKT